LVETEVPAPQLEKKNATGKQESASVVITPAPLARPHQPAPGRIPAIFAGSIVVVFVVLFVVQAVSQRNAGTVSAAPLEAQIVLPAPVAFEPAPPVLAIEAEAPLEVPTPAIEPVIIEPVVVPAAVPVERVRPRPQVAAIPAASGKLAVSSPTFAEIYLGDTHLGSTPTTLELPAGTHTLEYRPLHINAKPWAQVFVDGVLRRPLGQTPLGEVRVAIGKVLVFENPKYPPKTYRVTGKETTVQVVFP
jgi:hypothetical protein